jgi:CelD/BcsL family acetyltransferase involved in cellulose biosynthesis
VSASATVEIVTTAAALDALAPEWHRLFAASPAASPPLHWDWVREWWRLYGPVYGLGGQGLRIFAVRADGRLLGVLPLYRRDAWGDEFLEPRRLLFLSQGEAPGDRIEGEYLDLLYAPGEAARCLAAIQKALLDGAAGPWDLLSLAYVAETSPLSSWVSDLGECGLEVSIGEPMQYAIADLADGFDAYVTRLSYKARRNARTEVKAAAKDGLVVQFAANETEAEAYFDEMVSLHQQHWTALGKLGCYASERFTAFHRCLCQKFVGTGFAVLARLRGATGTLAVVQGFVVGNKFHAYQSGRSDDRQGQVASPSTAMHLLLMKRLLERGVTQYDFLAGALHYKHRLCTDYQPFRHLRLVNPTWRVKAHTVYGGLKRRALRMLGGRAGRNGAASAAPAARSGALAVL